ncbi:MAG: type II toxin-antitoxin system HicB family antitoxin [Anaerolineae bacterium]
MEAFKYTVVLERDEEGGYTVTVPALPGCVTQGDTIAESLANAKEAIEVYLESLALDGEPFPPDVKEANIQLEETEEVLIFKLWVEPEVELAQAS